MSLSFNFYRSIDYLFSSLTGQNTIFIIIIMNVLKRKSLKKNDNILQELLTETPVGTGYNDMGREYN